MIENNSESGRKTLLVVYYAGHGCMIKNTTQLVLNDPDKSFYKMENVARVDSEIPDCYLLVVFDCCREDLNDIKFRSGGEVSEQENNSGAYRNLILINGCAPNSGVEAKSSIA